MIHEVDTLFEADCYVLCQADIYLSCPVRRTPTSFVRKNEYLLIKLSKLDAYFLGPQERTLFIIMIIEADPYSLYLERRMLVPHAL